MGYEKGRLSRSAILHAAERRVLAKSYGAPLMGELAQASGISTGKLTHHFATKTALYEALSDDLMKRFRARPLARLGDTASTPAQRIRGFFAGMLELYGTQYDPIGCPIAHAAEGADGVTDAMRTSAYRLLQETEALFRKAF